MIKRARQFLQQASLRAGEEKKKSKTRVTTRKTARTMPKEL